MKTDSVLCVSQNHVKCELTLIIWESDRQHNLVSIDAENIATKPGLSQRNTEGK